MFLKKEKAEIRHSQPQTVTLAGFVYKHKAEPKVVSAQEGKPVIKISCCMHVKAELPLIWRVQMLALTAKWSLEGSGSHCIKWIKCKQINYDLIKNVKRLEKFFL